MFYRNIAKLSLAFAALCSIASANENLGKRAALLESRQTCSTAGWIPACPGPFKCIPPGGICCSDGISYAMPPETCPDGTQPIATAPLSTNTPIPSITAIPTSTRTIVEYTWYTITYTYYYYYYYYTYIAVEQTTRLTSSQVTSITTLSVSATNEAQASSLFGGIEASLTNKIPSQTVTPTNGYTPPPSFSSTTKLPTINGTVSGLPTSSIQAYTGAANAVTVGRVSTFGSGMMCALAILLAAPGFLMVWL